MSLNKAGPSNLTPLSQFVLHPFSYSSVAEALKTINAKKTTEDHLDPFFLIKTYAPLIIDSIIYIFNQVFLMAWFQKSGKQLMSCLSIKVEINLFYITIVQFQNCPASKILQSLVNNQLKHYLTKSSILSHYQPGFRMGHSTISSLS